MNRWIKIITSLMIIILIALLILIFLNYFNNREIINIINSNNSNVMHTSGENTTNNNVENNRDIIDTKEESGDIVSLIMSGESNIEPVPEIQNENIIVSDTKVNNIPDVKPNNDSNTEEKPKENNTVITSNVDTSNEEKRQVLNELDSALKGLLDVVSKVPTVDEEKLDASLKVSEVSP